MKKLNIALAFALIAILFASCDKTPENPWKRFWGFTKEDIAGHYQANPDPSLYEELPTEGIVVYNNATMEVTALSGNLVSIHVDIPEVIHRAFSGAVYSNESNSDIVLTNGNYDIRMTVYKSDEGKVKFHGRVQQFTINVNNERINLHTYGFDVIKEE